MHRSMGVGEHWSRGLGELRFGFRIQLSRATCSTTFLINCGRG